MAAKPRSGGARSANRRVEEAIERLNCLPQSEPGPAAEALRAALSDRVNLVAAKAAKMAAQLTLRGLIPELLGAFDRLMENAAERDPQCWGKNAIAKALVDLDYRESAPFLRGAGHIQMEPVWGGQEDTASTLRGTCLLALPACSDIRREQIFRCLVDALTDRALTVRTEAVRAIEQMEGDEAMLLLRLKAGAGDSETRVTGQVFDALLHLEREAALPFLERFLKNAAEDVQDEAALAIGASRLPGSVPLLQSAWEQTSDTRFRAVLLRAISASREDNAIAFLLNLVRRARQNDAEDALEALALHRDSVEVRRMVSEAVGASESALRDPFTRLFDR